MKINKQDKIIELLEEINRKLDRLVYMFVQPFQPSRPYEPPDDYYTCSRCHGRYPKNGMHLC